MIKDSEKKAKKALSNALTQLFMVCGTLLAIANGFIPSLSAMIYGGLTDELVASEDLNCTLDEAVSRFDITNVTEFRVIHADFPRISINESSLVEVILNGTVVRVKVVTDGETVATEVLRGSHVTLPTGRGTVIKGTKLTEIKIEGANVNVVKIKRPLNQSKSRGASMSAGNETRETKPNETLTTKNELENNSSKENGNVTGSPDERGNGSDASKKNGVPDPKREIVYMNNKGSVVVLGADGGTDLRVPYSSKWVLSKKRRRRTLEAVIREMPLSGAKENNNTRTVTATEPRPRMLTGEALDNDGESRVEFSPASSTNNLETLGDIHDLNDNSSTNSEAPKSSEINSNSTRQGSKQRSKKIRLKTVTYVVRNVTEDCILTEERLDVKMRKYAVYYLYAALATFVCAYGQIVFWNLATERGARDAEMDMTETALNHEPGFVDTKIYEGAPNLQGIGAPDGPDAADVQALSGGLGGEIAFLIQSVSNFASSFVVSFIQNWKITLVMMAAGPVLASVEVLVHKIEAYIKRQKEELQRRASNMARKSLANVKTVVSNVGENVEKGKYSQRLEASNQLNRLKSLVLGLEKGFMTLLSFGFLGLAFWYSTTLLPSGAVTPGALMTIFMAIISGAMQMEGAGEQAEDVASAQGPLDSLLGFLNQGANDEEDVSSKLDDFLGKLDVFNVHFHYPSRPEYQILKSVNLSIEPGQMIALLGEGGCGKSTLMKLLQRIYDPQTGKVRLDGHDIRELDRRWYRRQIGIVHKNPEFFKATIAENIAHAKDGCTLKEVIMAAEEAGADEFILNLPRGYATVLADDGSPLSPYQKHLLALARALIAQPKILLWEDDASLMDDATLDSLVAHLNRAQRGRTTVLSTSRVAVARVADVIVVLHDGEIAEQGAPAELLASHGAYAYMCTVQHYARHASQSPRSLKTASSTPPNVSAQPCASTTEGEASLQAEVSDSTDDMKGAVPRFQQMIKLKVEGAKAKYHVLRPQLMDAPLMLAAAAGASITGMMAPGLSYLFSEIQGFLNDPVRVQAEGPFFASMFLVLGLVVAFGGTIETYMTTLVTEKLRTRLQKSAFESKLNQNAAPQKAPAFPSGSTPPLGKPPSAGDQGSPGFPGAAKRSEAKGEQPLDAPAVGSPLPSKFRGRKEPGLSQSSAGFDDAFCGKEGPPGYDPSREGVPGAFQPAPDILLPTPDAQAQAQEVMDQVQRDIDAAVQNSIGRYLGPGVQNTVSSVVTMLMAFYNGWKMTLVVLAGLPIIATANKMQGGSSEDESAEKEPGIDELMGTSFKKLQTISAIGAENKFANKYKDAAMQKYKEAIKRIIASGLAFAVGQATVFLIYAAALRFGCYLVQVGDMTALAVMSVLMTVLFGSSATAGARAPSHDSEGADESMERLADTQLAEVLGVDPEKKGGAQGGVAFEHVEFPDPLNKCAPLLSGLDLDIPSGSVLALVALGKFDRNPVEFLLERFYDPSSGRVLLDNQDVRSLNLKWLRSQHAVVSEHAFLPHCSIAENIAYGDNSRNVSRREIEDAAYSANAHAFIPALPQPVHYLNFHKGYDTVVDEEQGQVSLSSSQKMRISIARALVRNPAVVIIQELRDTDEDLDLAIQNLCKNRTSLVVARHRSTVEGADKIVLLHRGRVLEQGTREELTQRRALFFALTTYDRRPSDPEL